MPKKVVIYAVVGALSAVVVLSAVIALAIVFGSPKPPGVTTTSLPRSSSSQLLIAELSDVNLPSGVPRYVARSYDGHPWEVVAGNDGAATLKCDNDNSCTITATGKVATRELSLPPNFSTAGLAEIASWYAQGGFGAPLSVLEATFATYGSDIGRWVRDQQNLPPTLTRVHFRKRNNPRPENISDISHPTTSPCDVGARWYRYVFEHRDFSKNITVVRNTTVQRFDVRVNGVLRAQIDNFFGAPYPAYTVNETNFGQDNDTVVNWILCDVEEGLTSTVRLTRPGRSCSTTADRVSFAQPSLGLVDTAELGRAFQAFSDGALTLTPVFGGFNGSFIVTNMAATCNLVDDAAGNAYMSYQGQVYRFDQRYVFYDNLVENPVPSGKAGNDQCPIAPSSFQTRDQCTFVTQCVAPPEFLPADLPLTDETMRAWYTDTTTGPRNYVYAVEGLRLEEPYNQGPCEALISRWLRVADGTCPNGTSTLTPEALSSIVDALTTTTDKGNLLLRDVDVTGPNCTFGVPPGVIVEADGACWQHVHPDYLNVHDATEWVNIHDGNPVVLETKGYNPIAKFAEDGSTRLSFPASHPLTRWSMRGPLLPRLGRLGDNVSFLSLPPSLRTVPMALRYGALRRVPAGGVIACGSRGEVASDPVLGDHYIFYPNSAGSSNQQLEFTQDGTRQISGAVLNVMFSAVDTLRQRVAWALSNFIVSSFADSFYTDRPEGHFQFYDILIKNAFGNFEDLLLDVSYNPMMSRYLTYHGSRSFAVSNNLADENYAREIMQLFSIGLNKLNMDGTVVVDGNGNPVPTYTNEDIIDYARVWTGFRSAARRSNLFDLSRESFVDPLVIDAINRDRLPKPKLDRSGYLGDGYPLCDELPTKPWLRAGATFFLVGSFSNEGEILDNGTDPRGRFAPSEVDGSELFRALCARPSSTAPCAFPVKVVLPNAIQCTGKVECEAEEVFSIRITDSVGAKTVYYRIEHTPCVRMTFFDGGRVLQEGGTRQCGNPISPRGQPACCPTNTSSTSTSVRGPECLFANDHTKFDTAVARCEAQGLVLCSSNGRSASWTDGRMCSQRGTSWTNRPCTFQLQVNGNGRLNIVDNLTTSVIVRKNTNNVFRAFWKDGRIPVAVNGACPAAGCVKESTIAGDSCICNFTLTKSAVFSSSDLDGMTLDKLDAALSLGAWAPSEHAPGMYQQCLTEACTALTSAGVVVWVRDASIDERTIFQLPSKRPGGPLRFLSNRQEFVNVGQYSFRNPPAFMPLVGYSYIGPSSEAHISYPLYARNAAEWETVALVRHLVEHSNTAPYVCKRLIGNMVTSNPSPRYVRRCATAFSNGAIDGATFSGKYGDLAAAVYAILTDREARSPLLYADPMHGMVVDPVVSFLRVMRSLEYKKHRNREILLFNYPVEPLNAPSVFNFFPADYQPDGPLNDLNMVAPQVELLTPFTVISLLNGLHSLAQNGLTNCFGGFGSSSIGRISRRDCNSRNVPVRRATSDGVLSYLPSNPSPTAEEVVSDLSVLLTAGRAHSDSLTWQRAVATFNSTLSATDNIIEMARIFLSSPEFFSSSIFTPTNEKRAAEPVVPSARVPHKSIFLHEMAGGLDSWNVLVPLSDCGAKDMYLELETARNGGLLSKARYRPLAVPAGTQPCNTFGLHDAMPQLKTMYDEGDALFFVNVGALIEPLTAEDVKKNRGRIPPSLFAHNIMRRSTNTLDPDNLSAHGILGRARDALHSQRARMNTLMASFEGKTITLRSNSNYEILASSGVTLLNTSPAARAALDLFVGNRSTNLIPSEFTAAVGSALESTERLNRILSSVNISGPGFGTSKLSRQANLASRLMKFAVSNSTDRSAFFTQSGGYDTHATFDIDTLLSGVDTALGEFKREMIAQGLWDQTVIVVTSEFARTLRSNGQGSDHAWGGHTFICGGAVKGGRILGAYPTSLTEDHPHMLSGGRLVPTMPFEAIWNGVLEWYGVQEPGRSQKVLPHLGNFPRDKLYSASDLFK